MEFFEPLRGFFPSGPLTTLYACFMLAVTVPYMKWGRKAYSDIAGLLFLSWWVALLATAFHSPHIQGLGTIAIMVALWRIPVKAAKYIVGLFAVKLLFYTGNISGMMEWESMWALSEAMAYLALFVLIGGSIGQSLGHHLDRTIPRRRDFGVLDVFARRRQLVDPADSVVEANEGRTQSGLGVFR